MMELLKQLAISIDPNQISLPRVQAGDTTFNSIVGAIYIIIAAISLFYIVRAGLLFVTSGSDPSSVKDARETILYAVLALGGSTFVFVLIQFVITRIGG